MTVGTLYRQSYYENQNSLTKILSYLPIFIAQFIYQWICYLRSYVNTWNNVLDLHFRYLYFLFNIIICIFSTFSLFCSFATDWHWGCFTSSLYRWKGKKRRLHWQSIWNKEFASVSFSQNYQYCKNSFHRKIFGQADILMKMDSVKMLMDHWSRSELKHSDRLTFQNFMQNTMCAAKINT